MFIPVILLLAACGEEADDSDENDDKLYRLPLDEPE